MGVKRVDKGRMEELREEVGVKEGFRRKLVRSQLKLAGHVEQIEGEGLMKRADRRGRPRLRWEGCVKTDFAGVDREGWGNGDGWWRWQ